MNDELISLKHIEYLWLKTSLTIQLKSKELHKKKTVNGIEISMKDIGYFLSLRPNDNISEDKIVNLSTNGKWRLKTWGTKTKNIDQQTERFFYNFGFSSIEQAMEILKKTMGFDLNLRYKFDNKGEINGN